MNNEKSLLKDKPEYEDYSDNIYYEVRCCCKKNQNEGCNGGKGGCCKNRSSEK